MESEGSSSLNPNQGVVSLNPNQDVAPKDAEIQPADDQQLCTSLENSDVNNDKETNDRPAEVTTESVQGLSKNQQRKLRKRQRWEENIQLRLERRQRKREAIKLKKQAKKAEMEENGQDVNDGPKKRRKKMSDPDASDVRVVIDCDFDELMTMQDVTKLSKQIARSYASNRASEKPFQFYVTNFGDKTKQRFQNGIPEHINWDVNIKEEGLNELFGKDSIVYLTSDSPKVMTDLDSSKVYVIGGLVDHNHHKGVCFKQATSQGWDHAQLPISEYMKFSTRKVLTVNQVFEILVAFGETKDWKTAFERVVPPRKFHTLSRKARRKLAARKKIEDKHSVNEGNPEEVHDGSKDGKSCDSLTKKVCEPNNEMEELKHDGIENKESCEKLTRNTEEDSGTISNEKEEVKHDGSKEELSGKDRTKHTVELKS